MADFASDRPISILDGSFCDMDAVDGPCAQKGDTLESRVRYSRVLRQEL